MWRAPRRPGAATPPRGGGRPPGLTGVRAAVVASIVAGLAHAGHAEADATAEEPTPDVAAEPGGGASRASAGAAEADRREPAYFHGRERGATAEEVLLWIPRILFSPLHLVAQVVRLPVLALLQWAEQNHLIGVIPILLHPVDVLYWQPNVTLEAGIFALPGLTVRLENLGVSGHSLRFDGAYANEGFWSLALQDRWRIGPVTLGVVGAYAVRSNGQFFGVGPASQRTFVFYGTARGDATAFVVVAHQSYVEVELRGGYAREEIRDGTAPSIDRTPESIEALGLGTFDLGLGSIELRLDTRRSLAVNGGFHMHASLAYGGAPGPSATQFLRIDADVEAAAELGVPDRVLAARVHLAETVSLDGGPIPFQHLPALGWTLHRGFVGGRFRGEAFLVAEARYRYPVHYFVDMEWTVSAGNAFARDFSDFAMGALTGSLSVGFRTRRTGLDTLSFGVGFGTTRFDQFDLEGVRFYMASSEGL